MFYISDLTPTDLWPLTDEERNLCGLHSKFALLFLGCVLERVRSNAAAHSSYSLCKIHTVVSYSRTFPRMRLQPHAQAHNYNAQLIFEAWPCS